MSMCAVAGCRKRRGHKFPRSPHRCKAWIAAVNRDENWIPDRASIVCFDHFCASDYASTTIYGEFVIFS